MNQGAVPVLVGHREPRFPGLGRLEILTGLKHGCSVQHWAGRVRASLL